MDDFGRTIRQGDCPELSWICGTACMALFRPSLFPTVGLAVAIASLSSFRYLAKLASDRRVKLAS